MIWEYTEIPLKKLNIGDAFETLRHNSKVSMNDYKVIEKDSQFIKLKNYNGEILTFHISEECYQVRPLSRDERKYRYKDIIEKIAASLREPISETAWAETSHEYWNAWIDLDIVELAGNLERNNLELIGYYILPESLWKDKDCHYPRNTALIAKDTSDNIFWCHCRLVDIESMLE